MLWRTSSICPTGCARPSRSYTPILGLHSTGKATKLDVPDLLKKANVHLGLDAAGVRSGDPGAEQRRKALGSLAQLMVTTAELRNAGFGTGHGLSRRPELDVPTARLVVAAAVAVATFYIEAHAAAGPEADLPLRKMKHR
jgi:Abortive infection C-terminus